MLFLRDIDLAFGGEPLFDGLTWAVRPGQRVGLVGPNGAGKTTLLRVMAGRQTPDAGEVALEGGASVGYLAQDVQEVDVERTPFDEAMQAFSEELALEAEEHRLADEMEAHPDHTTDDYHRLVERFDRVHNQLVAREVHTVPARTESVLSGLGFTVDEMRRPLRTFSGGWRMRVTLARILLQEPTVLLLDEPTNHLDIESIAWLETYLKGYPGAVVLVSHDRYFLDRMTTATAELVGGGVDEYAGNYTFYLEAREERRQLWRNAYENQQRDIAQTERFIERFRAKATKAKQAQSRIKALDRLERIPPPPRDAEVIRFRFPEPARSGRVAVELSRFSKTYPPLPDQDGVPSGRNVVFTDAGPLAVERGHKVALIGKNGAGKSTLARILLGQEPFEGSRTLGPGVTPAHFAQHQAEALDRSQDVLTSLRSVARGQSDTQLRTLLGAFLFQGDDVFKPVSVLSGGERSRVALARTLLSPANLLVLDEPTNHLDLSSKAVLAEALRQYAGALVLISHDRHFLDAIVDQVWYVEEHTVRVYSGTYSETEWQRAHGTAASVRAAGRQIDNAPTSSESGRSGGKKTKEQKRAEAEARNAAYRAAQGAPATVDNGAPPARKEKKSTRMLEKVESEVAAKEAEKAAIEAVLADPELYQDAARFQSEMSRFREVESSLKELYARWETLAEEAGQ